MSESVIASEARQSSWRECRLGDVALKIGSGATPRGGGDSYKESGISLIRSQNILDFKFSNDGLAFIDNEQADGLKNVTVEENDVLLNITGDSVARCCIVPKNILPARVNQHVAIIRPNPNKADYKFIFYSLQSIKNELLQQAEIGATRNALTKWMIENLDISIPPIEEQKAIADVLSSLDDKIDLLHRQNHTLESLAQTLFRQWFIEEAKDEWELTTLCNLGKVVTGKTPSTNNEDFWGDSIPFITPTDFKNYNKYAFTAERSLSALGKDKVKNSVLPKNSILVTCIGSDMGKVAIAQNECVTNQQINSLVLENDNLLNEYVFQYLKSIYPLLRAIALGGTTMPIINKTDFENIETILPSDEALKKFHKTTLPFNEKIIQNTQQIQTLENLRDTLLPKLLNGEARIECER